ncbi:MAG TPA: hypothetical protein DDZ88_11960 [Verrucomicrobiales bacterium]|nr:hypothetical protein [Verrucomicrobiales bacterium]
MVLNQRFTKVSQTFEIVKLRTTFIETPILWRRVVRMNLTETLRRWPRAFDLARTASRIFGRHDSLYLSLKSILPKLGPDWTFLQAGAHDGLRNDPFREFILSYGARGILIEPWPRFYDKLRENYRHVSDKLSFVRCALTYPAGNVEFHSFTEEFVASNALDPIVLSTAGIHHSHLLKQVQNALINTDSIASMTVPGLCVEDVMSLSGLDHIDALFFDLEGHEPNILDHMNFAAV